MLGESAARPARIGIDTGGTFTDFVWFEDGQLKVHKELSTAQYPSQAILSGLNLIPLPPAAPIVHGSTVATNALLERRGARTALITTAGFRDVLALGRQNRPDLYALVPRKPPELVPRAWRYEVDERVDAQGEALRALGQDDVERIAAALRREGIESVAVCLLFSFLYPQHEEAIRDRLQQATWGEREAPLHVSLSSEILPEYREYERTATTVINAYVAPVMGRYLERLAHALRPRPVAIMQSNGGLISTEVARDQAARTVLSGPAGGVVGAFHVARQAGFAEVITFDMGGTSSDVALCPGELPATSHGEIASMPLRLPALDIHTVGAGGGSLVSVDAGGALHVGPQSAGADPGPISYGRGGQVQSAGGENPTGVAAWYVTTTDANLVLGRLDADHFLGGEMRLDRAAALHALERLAQQIGAASPQAAAWDVVRVANATMERAMRRISVERGFDPRSFTLVAFGGAGPLHACDLAASMRIPRVLIPPASGVLSALGMLAAQPTRDYSQTLLRRLEPDGDLAWVDGGFEPLYQRAVADMSQEGVASRQLSFQLSLDLRYLGQSHELNVPYTPMQPEAIAAQFHAAHEQRYGYRREQAMVELVTLRLRVLAPAAPLLLPRLPAASGEEAAVELGRKPVWFGERYWDTALYERAALKAGQCLWGPAIIFQYDSTTVAPPGWRLQVHETGSLILTTEREE